MSQRVESTPASHADAPSGGGDESDVQRPTLRRRVIRLLVIAAVTYAGMVAALASWQTKLIYFPTREYYATPADFGLEYDELMLTTADGVRIAAWYAPYPSPRASVIFFHGNAGNMADRLHTIRELHRLRLSVLIIDYRGYGRSEGTPTEQGTYEDALAAWKYLNEERGEPPSRIVLFGRSLGGAIAIELAHRHEPAALIVESTFTSLEDVGRIHYPLLPVRLLLRHRYDSIDKVRQIACPKLFIHGVDDGLIPIENGRKLFEAAAEPKQFLETPGDHNDAGFMHSYEYLRAVDAFLDKALAGP